MSGGPFGARRFGTERAVGFTVACAVLCAAASPARAAAQTSPNAPPDPSGGSHTRAALLLERATVTPGGRVRAALELTTAPGWHTYWRNPGDAGGATRLAWALPAGWTSAPLGWPTPERLVAGPASAPLVSYGYGGTVRLPVTLRAPATLAVGDTVTLRGTARWIACADVCIPGSAEVERTLRVVSRGAADAPDRSDPGMDATNATNTEEVRGAFARVPAPLGPSWAVRVRRSGGALALTLVPTHPTSRSAAAGRPRALAFYAADAGTVDHAASQSFARRPDAVQLRVPLARAAAPTRLRGLLVPSGAWAAAGDAGAVWIDVPVGESAPVAPAPDDATPDGTPSAVAAPVSIAPPRSAHPGVGSRPARARVAGTSDNAALATRSRAVAVLLALAGGALLNVMPCVLPVVALKVLGLVALGGGDLRAARRHGLAFAGGVVAAFAALGGILAALRAAGRPVGWGFQLQTPGVVAALALLFVALALNLFGVYEVGTGLTRLAAHDSAAPRPVTPGPATPGAARRPPSLAASAGSGALAVAVATPCTAPFMGAALGWALVRPPADALLVMIALGTGMAVPYALLAARPAALRRLPRPGAWMGTVRQLLAFPLLATAVWLAWVYGRQTGVDGMPRLLAAALLVAAAVWGYGRFAGPEARAGVRNVARIGAAGLTALACATTFVRGGPGAGGAPAPAALPASPLGVAPLGVATLVADGTTWHAWSPARVDALRRARRPVFVDFTADWCVSCKVNERVALADADVRRGFASRGVVLLRADWTRGDAAITRALAAHGRDGVPLYLVYPADSAASPTVLPALLTPRVVLRALAALAHMPPPADAAPTAGRPS